MNIEKWINEYIKNVDLKNVKWIKLNSIELNEFLKNNYYDSENYEYVHDKDANSAYPTLLGMTYLNLYSPENDNKCSFLLGIVDNNIGKKTIISAIVYLEEYFVFSDQTEPLTYISTIEVNSFFRNQGLCKKTCEVLFDFISHNQHIIISQLSEMWRICNIYEILKIIATNKGYEKHIIEDNYYLSNSRLHEIISPKQKQLKK